MCRNLLYLKNYEGDVADLGLDFTVVSNDFGETKVMTKWLDLMFYITKSMCHSKLVHLWKQKGYYV